MDLTWIVTIAGAWVALLPSDGMLSLRKSTEGGILRSWATLKVRLVKGETQVADDTHHHVPLVREEKLWCPRSPEKRERDCKHRKSEQGFAYPCIGSSTNQQK